MTVEEAKANLWAYINGLPTPERERAIAYQNRLEAEAEKTEGGMSQVIVNHMRHNAALMEELVEEVNEIVAARKVVDLINKVQR